MDLLVYIRMMWVLRQSSGKAASAAVLGDEAFSLRLPDKSSIFTAEMYALLKAFQ